MVASRIALYIPRRRQAAHRRHHPDHDVQRMVRLERRPRVVRFPGPRALRLPPGTAPLATPPEQQLLHVPFPVALLLRRHDLFITIPARTVN
jgi:hypothetical protein